MNKQPFLPLFFGDLLASTAEWEGEERALYLLLLGYQWSLGSLPPEPKRICKLVGYSANTFDACWPVVGKKFVVCDGRLINERLESHREKAKAISDKRANAGAKGGSTTQAKLKQMLGDTPSKDKASGGNLIGHPNQTKPNHITETALSDNSSSNHTERVADFLKDNSDSSHTSTEAPRSPFGKEGGGADNPPAISEATQLAIDLRKLGVNITSQHPTLHQWLKDGFTPSQVIESVSIARISKPKPEAIPANYLTPILQDIKNPTKTKRSEAREHWQKVMAAVKAGAYSQPNFSLGADIDAAVRAIGGYSSLGRGTERDLIFNEKKFRDAYAELAA